MQVECHYGHLCKSKEAGGNHFNKLIQLKHMSCKYYVECIKYPFKVLEVFIQFGSLCTSNLLTHQLWTQSKQKNATNWN